MSNWWKKFREFDDKGLLIDHVDKNFAYTKRGYVFNRTIFQVYFVFILLLLVYIGFTSKVGWREMYIHCPETAFGNCENPVYLTCDREICQSIKYEKYLAPGFSLGNAPDPDFMFKVNAVWILVVLGFIAAFFVNHRMYNKNRSLEDIFPEKMDID